MSPRGGWWHWAAQIITVLAFTFTVFVSCNHVAMTVEHRITQLEVSVEQLRQSVLELRSLFLKKHLLMDAPDAQKNAPGQTDARYPSRAQGDTPEVY